SEAVGLTQHAFVPGGEGEWVERQRRELVAVRTRALVSLSEASLRLGDAGAAVRWAEQMIAAEPFSETGYRPLMEAQAGAGHRAEALRVYERCRRLLAEELGADPSPETESVYRELLRGGPARSTVAVAEPGVAPVRADARDEAGRSHGPPRARRRRLLVPLAARGVLLRAGPGVAAVRGRC